MTYFDDLFEVWEGEGYEGSPEDIEPDDITDYFVRQIEEQAKEEEE